MRYYQFDKYSVEFVLSENIDKHFALHNHVRHYIISVVMQGEVFVFLENKRVECSRGDMFTVPPYAMHSVYQGRDTRLLSVCIGTSFVNETDLETAEDIIRNLVREIAERETIVAKQAEKLLSAVRMVYCLWEKGEKEISPDIKTLADKMIGQPQEQMRIETMSHDIFVSKYYLIRKFKSYVGMTPHQFCIQNRIRKSQSLLNAEKTIGEIAEEMGFYDQSHFDKAFHRIVGISPAEYVRSKRQIEWAT